MALMTQYGLLVIKDKGLLVDISVAFKNKFPLNLNDNIALTATNVRNAVITEYNDLWSQAASHADITIRLAQEQKIINQLKE